MHFAAIALLLSAAPAPAAPAAAQDITGVWATNRDGGQVRVYPCGRALCGRLIAAAVLRTNPDQRDANNRDAELRARPLRNLMVLSGFTGGGGNWRDGSLYDPETGRTASGTIELRADGKLAVRGCVAIFCRTQVWTRVR